MWFTDEAIAGWAAEPRTTRGGQPRYSPLAILTALTIHAVFRLANRHRTAKLAFCRDLLAVPPPSDPEPPGRRQDRLRDLTGHDLEVCPGCGGRMLPYGTLRPRPPPRPPMWCDSS